MSYSHVAHDCFLGNSIIIGNATQLAGEVVIDDWAILSGGCLIHQFCHIGQHVIIQGGSRCGKDVPPYVTAGRDPLTFAGINLIGLRRRNFSPDQIQNVQECYRTIYQSGLNNSQAVEKLEADLAPSIERDTVLNFLKTSQRGIIRGYND